MRASIETITPEKATKWLSATNKRNRNVNKQLVRRIASDIENGSWILNGEAIILNGHDQVIDGQHRLEGVVASEVPIKSIVVRGAPADAFATIDCGKSRTPGDVLGISGIEMGNEIAAALRFLDKYEAGSMKRSNVALSHAALLSMAKDHPGMAESANYVRSIGNKGLMTSGCLIFCHYVCSKINKADADDFIKGLVTGEGLRRGTPLHQLRERLIEARSGNKTRNMRTSDKLAIALKAWNLTREQRNVEFLAFRSHGRSQEQFPVAV